MGLQDEGVVSSQRERVGGQLIQLRLPEAHRRLHLTPGLLLAQNVGDVIGAEGASCVSFLHRAGDRFRTVVANEFEQFAHLPDQGAIGVGKLSQIRLGNRPEQQHQPLLGGRVLRGGHLRVEFLLEWKRSAPKVWPRSQQRA